MKNNLFILYLLLVINNCSSQTKIIMEKFDINKLKENQKTLKEKIIEDKNTLSKVGETSKGYYEYKYSKINPYVEKKFYFENLALKSKTKMFYEVPTGKQSIYNEKGVLISEKDFDSQRHFSIDQLVQKMQSEFNINLLIDVDKKGVSMSVSTDNKPCYEVVLKDYYSEGVHRLIDIDVNDGKVLKDVRLTYKK